MSTTRVWMPVVTDHGVGEMTWSSPYTTADIFLSDGALTITATRTGEAVQTFHPNCWIRCTVYDDDGYPDFSFTNGRYGAAAKPTAA